MATIDYSTIEGFDTMTAEQKVEALLKVDVPEKVDLSAYVPKATADKYASEAADYKKQLAAKMTDDEKAAKEAAEEHQKIVDELNALKKQSAISGYVNSYLAMGYDEKLAKDTAEALFNGNMDKVFENQKTFHELQKKVIRAEVMKDTPGPNGAGGGGEAKKANVELAAQLGKEKNASLQNSNDIVSMYTK